jgi:hypothetical protein
MGNIKHEYLKPAAPKLGVTFILDKDGKIIGMKKIEKLTVKELIKLYPLKRKKIYELFSC